jgi:hypothetical protein
LLSWWTEPDAAPPQREFVPCSWCTSLFEPVVGEYYSKFEYVYCKTKCLRAHRLAGWRELEIKYDVLDDVVVRRQHGGAGRGCPVPQ